MVVKNGRDSNRSEPRVEGNNSTVRSTDASGTVEEVSAYDQWLATYMAAKRARRVQHARALVGITVGTALVALLTENPGLGVRLGIVLGIVYGALVVIENAFVKPDF